MGHEFAGRKRASRKKRQSRKIGHSAQTLEFRSLKSADNRDQPIIIGPIQRSSLEILQQTNAPMTNKVLIFIRLIPDEDGMCSISVLNAILIVFPTSLMSF
jgi:hypothetical protein